jgi:enoyl-CoA hydratase/carnithine racemase
MKLLKPLLLSAFLGASMGVFSTAALAECEDGRTCFEPEQAIDMTVAKIMEARHAIDNGADNKDVLALIREAKNLNKEINANDIVDRKRQKAASFLKKAKKEMKKSQNQVAEEHLKEAEKLFKGLHGYL